MSQDLAAVVKGEATKDELESSILRRRPRDSEVAFGLWPARKKSRGPDPIICHGRRFGRLIHALVDVRTLIDNGLPQLRDPDEQPDESRTPQERRERRVFDALLQLIPGLEERLKNCSDEEAELIADSIQKGASGARVDDTRVMKRAILDWIAPAGEPLNPPLARNAKADRGFNHERTGALLCPTGLEWADNDVKQTLRDNETRISGDQWPVFLYHNSIYDPQDPWKGLCRSSILLSAFRFIFSLPCSADKEPKATHGGIREMPQVTAASIAYVATQVQFALSSSTTFTKADKKISPKAFYTSLLDLFEDPEEKKEVDELLNWWNQQILSNSEVSRVLLRDSTLVRIKERRATYDV